MQTKDNTKYLAACLVMLIVAFIQCYRTVHDLHWASEPDFDRDIAYIRGMLTGHYGQDPNMAGQYMWYNPLLFVCETVIVKITGLPINIVVARAGAFLNIINPIVFFIVVVKLFDYKVALASLLCFLFLVSGNLPCWGAATYSPWLISDTFVQFIDVRDLADWTLSMIERNETGAYNAQGVAGRVTMGDVLKECKSVSGSDASFTWASEEFLLRENVAAWTDMPLWLPIEAAPHLKGFMVINGDKAVRAGLSFRSLNDTIAATLAWYQETRNDPLKAGLDSNREQSLLGKLHASR